MANLYDDVLFSISQELQNDRNSLISLLLVNKAWSKVIVPILWKNPWEYLNFEDKESFLDTIISHLSNDDKDNLNIVSTYDRPLFNYVEFCKHLDLTFLESIIGDFQYSTIKDKIFNLFINKNTRITHLNIHKFNYPIHNIPDAKICLSGLEFLKSSTLTNGDIFLGLSKICNSVKEFNFSAVEMDNYDNVNNNGIIDLIKVQKKLNIVQLYYTNSSSELSGLFIKNLEDSLINHKDTIQYFNINKKPVTKLLSSLKSLKSLEIRGSNEPYYNHYNHYRYHGNTFINNEMKWKNLKNLSLPHLQILKVKDVPMNILLNIFENSRALSEVIIDFSKKPFTRFNNNRNINGNRSQMLIQIIYQHCPNLKYLGIPINNHCNLDLKNLLTECKYLEGLYITMDIFNENETFDKLFEILSEYSPNNLFKFTFESIYKINIESFKSFFYYWRNKNRHPMLFQTAGMEHLTEDYLDLFDNYEFLGTIKKYNVIVGNAFKDFEWSLN